MPLNRRDTLLCLAAAGIAGAASRLDAASLSDWVDSVRIANLFVSAGIPAKSYSSASTKMMPSLAEGDVVLADLRIAGKQPERGELILSWYDRDTVYFDRVIGLPGDHIALSGGKILLNGRDIPQEKAGILEYEAFGEHMRRSLFVETLPGARPYKVARNLKTGGYLDNVAETVVAPGHLYLLGDNRDDSVDSRVAERGQVPIEAVIGRVVYRLRPNAGWLVPRETVAGLPSE
jgi:signal peptidase I